MLETLFGGIFGGLLRLLPEVLGFFDKKGARSHELSLLNLEMEFAKVRGEIAMRQVEASMQMSEMDAIGKAFQEQSQTAQSAGKFVAAISALVRPLITYAFVGTYFLFKFAMFFLAMEHGVDWKSVVIDLWTQDDVTIMFMIISFWFVGRVWDKVRQSP